MTVRPIYLLLSVGFLLLAPATAPAQEQPTLEQRYQEVIDTVVARLQLADSVGQQFRTAVGSYLTETEKIFAEHQGKTDRESMDAMAKELSKAREGLDRRLETFLSKEQVAQVRAIMDDLRERVREADSESAP